MRFGSVCSGIEAASVAWHPLGWEAAWLSEIEPFPCAVLKHHYPDVPNYGDMTLLPDRILSGEVEAPDLFCGGTPCQAFSVAGLRNSLDDARGNLSLTFVGIANAIDHVRSVRSASPAIIFWENVPGVLNTKDNAFGCFLGALAGESDQIKPPGDKWTNAGCVFGPQRAVAWRVLDAQYFGVAQRRRRVFVVASARDDFDPASVLFEFEGVRRDTAPSREARQEVAGTIAARFGISRNNHEECVTQRVYENHPADSRVKELDSVCSTVTSRWGTGGGNAPMVSQCHQTVGALCADSHPGAYSGQDAYTGRLIPSPTYAIQGSMIGRNDNAGPQGDGINVEVCFTQNTIDRHAVAQPIAFHPTQDPISSTDGTTHGLGCGSSGGQASIAIAHEMTIPIDSMNHLGRINENHSMGDFIPGAPSYTLTKGHSHAVAHPIAFEPGKLKRLGYGDAEPGLAPSLRANAGDNQLAVAQPMVLMDQGGSVMNVQTDGTTGTLRRETHGHEPVVMAPTLTASNDPSRSPQSTEVTNQVAAVHAVSMAVRRLTPVECERLQGFPDGYTNIPWRKAAESPDGPRYKALGNSWAVPVVRWIGKRIQERITT